MRKVKVALLVILVGFIAAVIYQNQIFFMQKQTLQLVKLHYKVGGVTNITLFLITFFIGFCLAFYFYISEILKSKKNIVKLNATIASQIEELTALKNAYNSLTDSESGAAQTVQPLETTPQEPEIIETKKQNEA